MMDPPHSYRLRARLLLVVSLLVTLVLAGGASAVFTALVLAIATGILAGAIALFSGQQLWRSFSKPLTLLEHVA
jgi:hypothetical protein